MLKKGQTAGGGQLFESRAVENAGVGCADSCSRRPGGWAGWGPGWDGSFTNRSAVGLSM